MWELRQAFPLGRISRRTSFIFATFALVVSFVVSLLYVQPVYAADATWNGAAITYNGKQLYRIGEAGSGDSHGLPQGTIIYGYTEPDTSGSATPIEKAHLIYFAPGTDPTTATSATYRMYDFSRPNTYSNGSTPATITVQPAGASSAASNSCDVDFGMGWIICGPAMWIAWAMDQLYTVIAGFLEVQPLRGDTSSPLFRAWSFMRNIANVAFVIAFLVLIYSQVTGLGVSNYGIKKLLPRLIAAALLVNLSFWICAIAVDLSNIFGVGLHDMLTDIRENMASANGGGESANNWQNWTSFILSGGTAAVGLGIALHSLAGTAIGASLVMLVPILVIVILSALVAVLVMALRQGIITILIIMSPLAFVAFLLPNTEKLFEKWRSLFTTMLMLFPLFAILFGGSQLAGMAIIQNATTINLVLLGMAVQVAPLIVTPLLIKFSGGLLGRIAGMVNNPNKGLVDRTRNWAKDKAERSQTKALSKTPENLEQNKARLRFGWGKHRQEYRRRQREGEKAAYQARSDAMWANRHRAHELHGDMEQAKQLKETGEAIGQAAYNRRKITDQNIQIGDVNYRLAKLDVDVSNAEADVQFENLKANESDLNVVPAQLAAQAIHARSQARESMVTARQLHEAKEEQAQNFAENLIRDQDLQRRAGGIGEHGADASLAAAIAQIRKSYGSSVGEASEVIKHFNLDSNERQQLAMGGAPITKTITLSDGTVHTREFTKADLFAREAAIEAQIQTGTVGQIIEIVEQSGGALSRFKTTISEAAAKAGLGSKAPFLAGATLNSIARGDITSRDQLIGIVKDNIAKNKMSIATLASLDKDAANLLLEAVQTPGTANMDPTLVAQYQAALLKLKSNSFDAIDNERIRPNIPDNVVAILQNIDRAI